MPSLEQEDEELVVDEVVDENEVSIPFDIAAYPSDLTLSVVHEMWRNGDIEIAFDQIQGEYTPKFGVKYQTRFKTRFAKIENETFVSHRYSLKTSYNSLLTARHQFVHQGTVPTNATYSEIKRGYESGKIILTCLNGCMKY